MAHIIYRWANSIENRSSRPNAAECNPKTAIFVARNRAMHIVSLRIVLKHEMRSAIFAICSNRSFKCCRFSCFFRFSSSFSSIPSFCRFPSSAICWCLARNHRGVPKTPNHLMLTYPTPAGKLLGIGGTRFISFEDRHWHNDCFICASCNTSLVGRGFITDEADIICPDCAKAKLM